MLGSCKIDDIDIGALGMFILRGGDYDFLSFPERKTPAQNNWHELNGLDVDLTEVYFKEKKVTVRFYIAAASGFEFDYNLNTFYRLISSPGYKQLYSRELGKTFSLRFVSCPDYDHAGGMYKPGRKRGEVSVEFSMDNPLQLFTGSANLTPRNGRSLRTYVRINNVDLADFGIIVNECYDSVLKLPAVKKPLIRSFERKTGLTAFTPSQSVFDVKTITIDCTMTANNRDDFYYNYEALFNNIKITDTVRLANYTGDDLCYYTSMQGFEKMASFGRRVLMKFSLNFVCINPVLATYILSTEGYDPVTPENMEALIPIGAGFKADTSIIDNFVGNVTAKGGNGQAAKATYDNLNLIIKTNASKILFPTVVEQGKVYGMDNNTGDLVTFPFSRASSATLFDINKNLQLINNDIPRIDYGNYTDGVKLLIEKQATNLLPNSDFRIANSDRDRWVVSSYVTAAFDVDHSLYTIINSTGTSRIQRTYRLGSGVHNISIYANTKSKRFSFASFVNASVNSQISPLESDYRIHSCRFTVASGDVDTIIRPYLRQDGGWLLNEQLFVKYIQIENGDQTSYIPTADAPATRAADLLTYNLPSACSVYIKTTKQNIVLDKPAGNWNIHNDLSNEGIEVIAIFDKVLTNSQKQQLTS
ncbi:MAG: hypothetical protein LBU84_16925 [Prevotella sp.]|jgi:hypothetical protein|nr:hypothetical protein [Prevotella sp.]